VKNSKALVVLPLLFASGCVTHYVQDATQPYATIDFKAQGEGLESAVGIWFEAHRESCAPDPAGNRLAIIKGVGTKSESTRKIRSGTELTLTGQASDHIVIAAYFCGVTGSFLPETGKSYEAELKIEKLVSSCSLAVYELTDSGRIPAASYKAQPYLCTENKNLGPAVNGHYRGSMLSRVPGK
jgi:hypothetical protein